jgi:hypothetical protein
VMACQSTAMWETAPAGVAPAVICFVSSIGLPLSLVMQDPHGKSARFRVGSHGHVLNPYPPPYRMAFASSRVPYPHPRGLALRLAFPDGRGTGLPRSARIPLDELGSACPPVAQHLREVMGKCLHLATYLLVQASQPLWLVSSHDVYQRFTSVSPVIPPSLPTALGLAVVRELSRVAHHHIGEATLSQELHTVGLPRPHVLVGYWWQNTRLCH